MQYRLARKVVKICMVLGITAKELRSKSRKQEFCDVRKIICFTLKENGLTLKFIARILKRDHSTVIYNLRWYDIMLNNDRNFKYKVSVVEKLLQET